MPIALNKVPKLENEIKLDEDNYFKDFTQRTEFNIWSKGRSNENQHKKSIWKAEKILKS